MTGVWYTARLAAKLPGLGPFADAHTIFISNSFIAQYFSAPSCLDLCSTSVEKEKPRGGNDDAAGGDGGRGKQAGDGGRKVKKGVGAKGGEGKWGGTKAGKYEEDEGDVDDDNTFRHACKRKQSITYSCDECSLG